MGDMAEKLMTYDPAEDLTSDAAVATFMVEAFGTEDAGYIAHAMGVATRAKGMARIARQTGLSREQLLSFVQREWQSDAEDHDRGHEGARD
jgi:probable addiction module antidote protein